MIIRFAEHGRLLSISISFVIIPINAYVLYGLIEVGSVILWRRWEGLGNV